MDILFGSSSKKFVTGAILVIIAFLIHVRNLKSSTDGLKLKPRKKSSGKVIYNSYFREEKVMLMLFSLKELKNY